MASKYWLRVLYFKLKAWDSNEWSIYGKTMDDNKKPRIEVTGNKYLSAVKDTFTIKIYNLPYSEIIKIQTRKMFQVQIFAGYLQEQNYNDFEGKKIFDGGIINMTCSRQDFKNNIVTFVCASKLVAKAQEFRVSISFNSGINLYSAVKYISQSVGLTNISIDESFKAKFITECKTINGTASSYLESLSNSNNTAFITSDSSEYSYVNMYAINKGTTKKIVVDPLKGMIINGQPTLTSNGLNFTSLPVYNYACGDILQLDNSLIDLSSGQDSFNGSITTPNGTYLNSEGLYYIYSMSYSLSNNSGSFTISINAKNKSLFDSITSYTEA